MLHSRVLVRSWRKELHGPSDRRCRWSKFSATDSSEVPVDLEKVFFQSVDADFWIHPGQARSLAELESMDRRFVEFRAFKNGKVYNNSKRIGPEAATKFGNAVFCAWMKP